MTCWPVARSCPSQSSMRFKWSNQTRDTTRRVSARARAASRYCGHRLAGSRVRSPYTQPLHARWRSHHALHNNYNFKESISPANYNKPVQLLEGTTTFKQNVTDSDTKAHPHLGPENAKSEAIHFFLIRPTAIELKCLHLDWVKKRISYKAMFLIYKY